MSHKTKEAQDVVYDIIRSEFTNYLNDAFTIKNYPVFSGKLKIIGNTKIISNDIIEEILDLLHEDYHDLGITLFLSDTRRAYLKRGEFNIFFRICYLFTCLKYDNRDYGCFYNEKNIVSMHLFNEEKLKPDLNKLHFVFSLVHEIRHSYQFQKKSQEYNSSKLNDKPYDQQWTERDANHFAQRFMNNNRERLNELLDISKVNLSWVCTWGRFKLEEE